MTFLSLSLFLSLTLSLYSHNESTQRMSKSVERTIAVIGASGNQGSGVVASLLLSTSFNVVAISSNPASSKVQALLTDHSKEAGEGRFKLVQGDLNDSETIKKALEGCYGLFASFAMTAKEGEGDQESTEVKQGKILVDVAKVSRSRNSSFRDFAHLRSL